MPTLKIRTQIILPFLLLMLILGVIGSYVWRAYENTKARPLALVMREDSFTSRDGA